MQTQLSLRTEERRSKPRAKRVLLPHMPIQFDQPTSSGRADVEQFIADSFYAHYQANITHFLPYLLSTTASGKLSAALGFQAADQGPLFLEQYLTDNIETEIGRVIKASIDRRSIAELGNLTSVHRGTSQLLFVLIVAILHEAGFEWTVFTATKQVQKLLTRLDLTTLTLCEADPSLLQDDSVSWGSYYDDKPRVIFGNITTAIKSLKQHPVTGFMIENYQRTISDIANKIKR